MAWKKQESTFGVGKKKSEDGRSDKRKLHDKYGVPRKVAIAQVGFSKQQAETW